MVLKRRLTLDSSFCTLNSDFSLFSKPLNLNLAVQVEFNKRRLKIKCRQSIISKKLISFLK
jgi:hypothetical protein